ncbi:GNAT family N-acetyltransferase [Chitinophaga sp. Ak27]|uniref:GNAT family N-acetyltransferase n=1 Tax=Chitinophaga sp. Ak27 TaxID=2726116 RepID=UPI00145CD4EA|nr:GNAT family protein [Chitinophaga sp. Ak27]NLU90930.1 GNAT family N-acetyltransferase [Chitinophaga sp. Ak27]
MNHLFPDQFPVLQTSRLRLIEIQYVHQPDLFYLFTDKQVTQYYHVIPLQEVADVRKIVDMLKQRFRDKQAIRWGIALDNQQELIGTIGFNSWVPGHKAVLIYALVQEYWGKGIMTEAINAVVQYGFNTLQLKRIEAEVLRGNTGSERVLQKTGFQHEGLLRQGMMWNGAAYDINMYARLATDPQP